MDTIFVERLVVSGNHGVSDRERATPQKFHIDILAEADTVAAGKTDDISDTVNYKDFVDIAKRVVEGPSMHLIETMAQKIADEILKDKRVKSVSVAVRKPRILPSGIPGVTITRRSDLLKKV